MSNSSLATVHYWTKNYSSRNGAKISKIIIHHMAGNLDAKGCYNVWKNRQGSAHYAISSSGQIGQLIDEKYRAWSVANAAADSVAVTMELANDKGASGNWHVSDKAIAACINLCVDICKRNGIKKLNFTGNKNGNLVMHCYYASTLCPGPYLKSRFKYIQDQANKRLGNAPAKTWTDYKAPFTVKVDVTDLYIRKGPGIANYGRQKVDGSYFIKKGTYTITEVKTGEGYYWGKLKSSTASSPRWIALDFVTFVKEVVNPNWTKYYNAIKDQASYMYGSTYKWQQNPTVAKSKNYGTCVTYVACVLQRYGAIKSGEWVYFENGKVYGTTSDMTVTYTNNKTPEQLKTILKKGDIVMHNDTKAGHIEIYAGEMKDGKAKYWTGGTGSGHNTSLDYWNKRKIFAIVRLKSIQ